MFLQGTFFFIHHIVLANNYASYAVSLKIANTKIAESRDDIRWLSEELQIKDSLFTTLIDVASGRSKRIASLGATIQDRVLWDPSTSRSARHQTISRLGPKWWSVVARETWTGLPHPSHKPHPVSEDDAC